MKLIKQHKFKNTHDYFLYLKSIVKHDKKIIIENLIEFERCLFSSDKFLQAAGIYSLIFKLQNFKKEYIECALIILETENEDYELITIAINGLCERFRSTKDKRLLSILSQKLLNKNEFISDVALEGLLIVYFDISHLEILSRMNYDTNPSNFSKKTLEFKEELNTIKKILKNC